MVLPEHAVFEHYHELATWATIAKGYLTAPTLFDGLSAQYDFSQLKANRMANVEAEPTIYWGITAARLPR